MLLLVVMTALAVSLLVAGLDLLRTELARHRRRDRQRFAEAAAEARRLAHEARIVDASISELAELVIEDSLREMGLSWDGEHIADPR